MTRRPPPPAPAAPSRVPESFQRRDVSFGTWGLESVDLSPFNSSRLSGLENGYGGCYVNAPVQALFGIDALVAATLRHVCDREPCVQCELAFLFLMLREAKGSICSAKNLARVLALSPNATNLRLMDDVDPDGGVSRVTRLMVFLLEQLNSERLEAAFIDKLFGSSWLQTTTCDTKRHVIQRTNRAFHATISAQGGGGFLEAFERALNTETKVRTNWCGQCNGFVASTVRKRMATAP